MSTSVTVDSQDPQINIVADPGSHGGNCQLMYIQMGSTVTIFHFDSREDLQAFVGLQVLAIGGIPGD